MKERGLHGEGEDGTEKNRMVERMRGWGREGRRTVQRRKEDDAENERGCCREDVQRKKEVVIIGKKCREKGIGQCREGKI